MTSTEIPLSRMRYAGRGLKVGKMRYTLRLLREAVAMTQARVAEATNINQGDISKLESREALDDVMVSTLRRYAKALGGNVEIVVELRGRRYTLSG